MEESPRSPARSRARWWRIVVAVLLVGLAAGLLSIRPWDAPGYDCAVTVRPGESIQAAIDAAQPGDVICLARGEWTESLVIDRSVTLVGWGAGRTVLSPAQLHLPVVDIPGRTGEPIAVKLERIGIFRDGGHTGVMVGGTASAELNGCRVSGMLYGVQAADSARLTLRTSSVSDSRQIAIVLLDSATAIFDASHVSDNRGLAIRISGSASADFTGSEISRNGGHGLSLGDEAGVILADSKVSGNGENGLLLVGESAARVLTTEVSGNSDRGIRAEDRATVELAGSSVLSNWYGVELTGSTRANIADAGISGNRWDGVRVENSAHAAISGSVLASNWRGLNLRGGATADLSDSLVEKSRQYGLFSASSGEATGEGNSFRDNGIDLGGNISGALRLPLREPVETIINWPDERFESLQEAIDALLPGGRLELEAGSYTAGLTIVTDVSLESGGGEVVLMGKSDALPVFSLVDGADLRLAGVIVSGGSTGLSLAAGARMTLVGCTVTGNTQGIYLSHSSQIDMSECSIVGNARSGVFVTDAARAAIADCHVSNHMDFGIAAANSAQLTVSDTVVTRCGLDGGILVWDSSQVVLEGNTISNNRGYGVATYWHRCFPGTVWSFRGYISGGDNVFEANWRGDVCPPELGFLSTPEGGELDLRPPPVP